MSFDDFKREFIEKNSEVLSDLTTAFLNELRKIAKIIDTPSQQRLERGGWGPISTEGIHRGDMYGEGEKVQSREPSPTKPLEKRPRRAHPKK